MDPSGKGPNGVQGLVTPKGTNSPSLGLVRDPKQLHQLYMTAPAPEERQRWARGDSNGHRERPMGPSSLAHTFCPGAPAGGTHPRASQNLHHRHGRTRSISRPRPSKAGLPGKTTTVTLSALSASMTPAGGGQGPRAPPQSSQLKLPGVTRGRPGHGCRCGWNAAVCQGRVTHPHTAQNTTGAAEPAPPARPLGGLPLRHGTDGTRMILPHLGSPSKIQLRARGSRSGCCPLHKLPFPDFPTSPRIIRSRCRGASPGVPTPTSAGHQFAPERRGRGGRHPDFLIEKPRECAIPSQQEGEKII